jgi:hypothetical protein
MTAGTCLQDVFGTGSRWLMPELNVKVKWLADKPVAGICMAWAG